MRFSEEQVERAILESLDKAAGPLTGKGIASQNLASLAQVGAALLRLEKAEKIHRARSVLLWGSSLDLMALLSTWEARSE